MSKSEPEMKIYSMAEAIAELERIIDREVEKSKLEKKSFDQSPVHPVPEVHLHDQGWEKLLIHLNINDVEILGLYDSGAQCSLLSQLDADKLQLGPSFDKSFSVRDAGGNLIPQKGVAEVTVKAGTQEVKHPFVVVDGQTPVISIFGLDLISALNLNLVIDSTTKEKRIHVGDVHSPTEIIKPESKGIFNVYQNLTLVHPIDLAPYSSKTVSVQIAKNHKSLSHDSMTILTQNLPDTPWPVHVTEQLHDVDKPIIQIELSNLTDGPLCLPSGAEVATFDCAISTEQQSTHYVFMHDRQERQVSALSLSPQDVQQAYEDFIPDHHEAPGFDHTGVKTSFDFTK